jgi:hypothetical protein
MESADGMPARARFNATGTDFPVNGNRFVFIAHLPLEGLKRNSIFNEASELAQGKTPDKPLATVANGLAAMALQQSER